MPESATVSNNAGPQLGGGRMPTMVFSCPLAQHGVMHSDGLRLVVHILPAALTHACCKFALLMLPLQLLDIICCHCSDPQGLDPR